jgi:glutathione S-transferase
MGQERAKGVCRLMLTLTHFQLCPLSRSIRLALAEYDFPFELTEVPAWDYPPQLLALNPAGELPVLQVRDGPVLCGTYAIAEFIGEDIARHPIEGCSFVMFPGSREQRAEIRRLVDWCHRKLDREVTAELFTEKALSRLSSGHRRVPDPEVMRAIRANLRYHLSYFSHLADRRRWLGGDEMSFADLAAAAHMSVMDYLDEVPWDEFGPAKEWYQRVKSRPSFRALLADRVAGVAPALHYADLDF